MILTRAPPSTRASPPFEHHLYSIITLPRAPPLPRASPSLGYHHKTKNKKQRPTTPSSHSRTVKLSTSSEQSSSDRRQLLCTPGRHRQGQSCIWLTLSTSQESQPLAYQSITHFPAPLEPMKAIQGSEPFSHTSLAALSRPQRSKDGLSDISNSRPGSSLDQSVWSEPSQQKGARAQDL